MKTVVIETTWLPREFMDFGWGNGYALVPKAHPLHGVNYSHIELDVHGGLTYSRLVDDEIVSLFGLEDADKGYWMLGFDTAHGGDTLEEWPKEAVQKETEKLHDILVDIFNKHHLSTHDRQPK